MEKGDEEDECQIPPLLSPMTELNPGTPRTGQEIQPHAQLQINPLLHKLTRFGLHLSPVAGNAHVHELVLHQHR